MAKLSRIFESINDKDIIKQKYYAEKIVENFLLSEGKIDMAYDINFIEDKIITEAFKKDSLDDSLIFVDGIMKQIDEGFMDGVKKLGKAAWDGVKKIGSKIKNAIVDLWTGPVVAEIKKWNKSITASAAKLEGMESFIPFSDSEYLFEMDNPYENQINRDDTKKPEQESNPNPKMTDDTKKPEQGDEPEAEEDSKVSFAFPTKIFLSGAAKTGLVYKSKIAIKYFKLFKVIINEDKSRTLSFSEKTDGEFIPMVKFIKKGQFEFINPGNIKISEFLPALFKSIASHPRGGLDKLEMFDVVPNGKVLDVTVGDKNKSVKAGKIVSINKTGVLKVKNADGTDEVGEESGATAGAAPDQDSEDKPEDKPEDKKDGGFSDKEEQNDNPSQNVTESKKIIDSSITAEMKGNSDGFYDRMKTTPEDTWKSFDSFAKSNNYRITSILRNTNGDIRKAQPMNESEYLAYVANMKPFINNIKEQPPQPGYNPEAYKVFLNSVSVATDTLAATVNRKLSFEKATDLQKSDNGTLSKDDKTSTDEQKTPMDDDTFNKMKL